jgi:cobalt-zinc-cadmium resistance protein CzcA
MKDMNELILKGTADRLRPVLLTAAAAALGFLPMAISSSAGAEVQRPLATVVIGGLFTATLLTMIVLPILFKVLDSKEFKKPKFKKHVSGTYIILFFISTSFGFSQNSNVELNTILAKAMRNNKSLKAGKLQVDKMKATIKAAYDFEKTNVYYSYDQNNLALNNQPLKVFGVQQSFLFPTVYGVKRKVNQAAYEQENAHFELQKNKLSLEISKTYHHIVYLQHQVTAYKYLDSLYQDFSKASDRRFELGETNYLEKITAEAKFRQIRTKLNQLSNEKKGQYKLLQSLVQSEDVIEIKAVTLEPINNLNTIINKESYTVYFESITNSYKNKIKLEKQYWLPNLNLEYFQGRNNGISESLYGFQVGVAVPLFFSGNVAKSKVAKLDLQSWEQEKQNEEQKIEAYILQSKNTLVQHQHAINYYTEHGEKLASEILKVADMSYKHGEIDFFQYIQSIENATTIQMEYLEALIQYNKTQLDLQYLNY